VRNHLKAAFPASELLVSFFKSAMSLLSPSALRLGPYAGREPGAIVVTLFEGTPYTLWNIRDLARHAGLAVETSFVFQANTYPGYQHARTLGNLKRREGPKHATGVNVRKGGDEDENIETDDDDKESEEEDDTATTPASAWRGENRAARTYIFKLKDEVMQKPPQKGQVLQAKKSKKRKAGPDDSDSDGEGDGVKAGRVPLLTQDDLRPQPSGKRFKHVRALPR